KINRDLTMEIANKAKNEGIKQFIFMSTMNVYGMTTGVVTKDTPCNPKTAYGKSKLEAENLLLRLQDKKFNVSIIRPPMVYGPNTVGNYVSLSKLAKITPIFPNINNQRSMIYIDNLTEFIRLLVENKQQGLFFPQNEKLVSTVELVKEISATHEKYIYLTNLFNPLIKLMSSHSIIKKVFGNLEYDQELSNIFDDEGNKLNFQVASFVESVRQSEK